MDEENKVETTEEEASSSEESQEENTEETAETAVEQGEAETSTADEDFHKAELERIKTQLGQAEHTIQDLRKKKPEVNPAEIDAKIESAVKRETARIEQKYEASTIDNAAARYAGSDAEKELNKHYFKSLDPALGTIDERMQMANAIANRNKNDARIAELQRIAKSKATRSGGSTAGAPLEIKKPLPYTREDVQMAKLAGVPVEEFVKLK